VNRGLESDIFGASGDLKGHKKIDGYLVRKEGLLAQKTHGSID
jgi:hypothetical protein